MRARVGRAEAWRAAARAAGALSVAALTAFTASGCSDGSEDFLPGHSRPMLEHDWPTPGELALGPNAFTPPDPAAARTQNSTVMGVVGDLAALSALTRRGR